MKVPLPFKVEVILDTEPYLYTNDGSMPWIVGTRHPVDGFDAFAMFTEEKIARQHAAELEQIINNVWGVVAPDPFDIAAAVNQSLLENKDDTPRTGEEAV